jgi:hypothetical protein
MSGSGVVEDSPILEKVDEMADDFAFVAGDRVMDLIQGRSDRIERLRVEDRPEYLRTP